LKYIQSSNILPQTEKSSWLGKTASNIVPDIGRTAIETVQGLGGLAKLGGQAMNPMTPSVIPSIVQGLKRGVYDPLKENLSNPSQIPSNMANYFQERPVASLLNLSAGLGLTGKLAQVGNLTKTANVLSRASNVVNPVTMATKPIAGLANVVAKTKIPESIYGRTMKMPPGSVRSEVQDKILNTMVREEKLPLGRATLPKMNQIIGELDNNINQSLKRISANGATMDVQNIVAALDNLKKIYSNRPKPSRYNDIIDRVKQTYLDNSFNKANGNPKISGKITLEDANQLKKGTYQEIQDYYKTYQKPVYLQEIIS
jgi:hypothetical protein